MQTFIVVILTGILSLLLLQFCSESLLLPLAINCLLFQNVRTLYWSWYHSPFPHHLVSHTVLRCPICIFIIHWLIRRMLLSPKKTGTGELYSMYTLNTETILIAWLSRYSHIPTFISALASSLNYALNSESSIWCQRYNGVFPQNM